MTTAIAVWWWIFLILAFLVTLVDVVLLRRVVRLSRQIRTLTAATLPAAAGIVANTAAGEALGRTGQLVTALTNTTRDVERHSETLAQQLAAEGNGSC
ncbi:hypothetical protein [Candidatus Entotheonella palauensis]|uniref:Uncharacterized protein n=1 Tax=Candidatus Entotheonella gemina TaxID=1429439 RepID=W4MBE8_9BACT|nr:hypothetical protein [Candidatus Entotheonella palauensis]ETX07510.1 MAG: hypothetical protein ETSY2_10730 [Candidatus Entotheonella gemina]